MGLSFWGQWLCGVCEFHLFTRIHTSLLHLYYYTLVHSLMNFHFGDGWVSEWAVFGNWTKKNSVKKFFNSKPNTRVLCTYIYSCDVVWFESINQNETNIKWNGRKITQLIPVLVFFFSSVEMFTLFWSFCALFLCEYTEEESNSENLI